MYYVNVGLAATQKAAYPPDDAKRPSPCPIQIWKFDKRFYTDAKDALKIPRIPLPPPWEDGWTMQDGMPFTQDLHVTMSDMITRMNSAIDILPNLLEKHQAERDANKGLLQ